MWDTMYGASMVNDHQPQQCAMDAQREGVLLWFPHRSIPRGAGRRVAPGIDAGPSGS